MRSHLGPILIVGVALALAACTPSGSTGATGAPGTAGQATTQASDAPPSADISASIEVLDFKLNPSTLSVQGTTLALHVTNTGPTVHNVTVRDATGTVLFGSRDLREGESETVTHAIAPGTYTFFCSLPGHESLGIKGTLTVTAK